MNDKITLPGKLLRQIEPSEHRLPDLEKFGSVIRDIEEVNPISEKAKSAIVKNTQSTIADIHKSTVEFAADMTARNSEAIASIGRAHESKASESIQAIERMNESGLKTMLKESKSSKVGTLGAAFLFIGAIGTVIKTMNKK